jgi:hypothetical protein
MVRTTGICERSPCTGEPGGACIPYPLPPEGPPLDLGGRYGPKKNRTVVVGHCLAHVRQKTEGIG